MKRIFVLMAFAWLCVYANAQFNLSGNISDEKGEKLLGAVLTIKELNISSVSISDGNYLIKNIPKGEYSLSISFLGYETITELINIFGDTKKDFVLKEAVTNFEDVVVSSIRAQANSPTTFSQISKKEISKINLGQDAPYLLSMEPSVVVSSDAGTGIGYTSMHIRGSDSRKINVTINGIPLNDPESHGVYWVDVPDIASSAQSIQIQRGIGTSTNGSGAFGASINLQTDNISQNPFYEYSGSAGSYNTFKNSLHFGTGLINGHWFLEGKLGAIKSDGYIDRGWSNLKSYFAQTGYYSDKTILKLVSFGGQEETYQAWYGIDSATMKDKGRRFNNTGIVAEDSGKYTFYDKMIDHYQQDHLQLHLIHKFSENLKFNAALHYTYGRGYYQDYVPKDWANELPFYNLPYALNGYDSTTQTYVDTVKYSPFIHRLWLDNDFYGGIWGLTYTTEKFGMVWGGAINKYDNARHFGEVIWAQYYTGLVPGKRYYMNEAEKSEWNTYVKASYNITDMISAFTDIQFRTINYKGWGTNKEYTSETDTINIDRNFQFVNPKVGLLYQVNKNFNSYISYAVSHREPTRDDIKDAPQNMQPKSETLNDLEIGFRYSTSFVYAEAVIYNMDYKNQLVLTGTVDKVGTPIRKNAGNSYRRGIELLGSYKPMKFIKLEGNLTVSENKTDFKELMDTVFVNYANSNIAYSPSIISGSKLTVLPMENLELNLLYKYVGEQYIDNTQNKYRKLSAYSITDFICVYSRYIKGFGNTSLSFKINNLLNAEYISNAYVYYGSNYYFPQATRNYMIGMTVRF